MPSPRTTRISDWLSRTSRGRQDHIYRCRQKVRGAVLPVLLHMTHALTLGTMGLLATAATLIIPSRTVIVENSVRRMCLSRRRCFVLVGALFVVSLLAFFFWPREPLVEFDERQLACYTRREKTEGCYDLSNLTEYLSTLNVTEKTWNETLPEVLCSCDFKLDIAFTNYNFVGVSWSGLYIDSRWCTSYEESGDTFDWYVSCPAPCQIVPVSRAQFAMLSHMSYLLQ